MESQARLRFASLLGGGRPALLTALSAGIAFCAARLAHAKLDGLWVVVSAIVVMQSTTVLSLQAARDRLIGTVVGALVGAVAGVLLPVSPLGVAAAVFVTGLVCTIPILGNSLRLASLTAAIVVLVPEKSSFAAALDRFTDTIVGVAVALTVTIVALSLERLVAARRT